MKNNAIGGFFELELPVCKAPLYSGTVDFQSARSAFLALLRVGKPRRVWMPYYICSTMLTSLKQENIEIAFYKVDDSFHLAEEIQLKNGDWFVYVNYFGICTRYAESLLASFDRRKVIIDSSQALFSPPLDCLATIYSPRKFLGVPDGGMLVSSLSVKEPSLVDGGSFERSLSLLKRAAFSPEEAYADHQSAENTLFDQEPKRMSELTRWILSSVDYEDIRRTRNRNFAYLHTHLGRDNLLPLDQNEMSGALCYPLLTRNAELRDFLISQRIFIPTYWKDVLGLVAPSSSETFLVQNLIPLPCDQRYGEDEMARVVNACREFFTLNAENGGLK